MHLFLSSDPTSCFSPCSLGSAEPNHTCLSANMSGRAQPWIVIQVNSSKEHADVLLFCTLSGWISSHSQKKKQRDLYSQAGFLQPSRWPSQPFLSESGGTYQRDSFSPKWGTLAGSADNKHPISAFIHYCGTSFLWSLCCSCGSAGCSGFRGWAQETETEVQLELEYLIIIMILFIGA